MKGMSKERSERMELEIASVISEAEQTLQRPVTMEERWLIRLAFLTGDSYGLSEARVIINY